MSASSIHILMTGGGAPGAAGILHCLLQETSFRVTVADANPGALGRYLHPGFETIPPASDPVFIDSLLALCKQKDIRVILPLVTKELLPLATNRSLFESAGIHVLVSGQASLEIAHNKSRVYEFLQWRGMEVPEFYVVETVPQFEQALSALGFPRKTVCFKPSVSNGSRGFRILSEHMDEMDLLFNYKPSSVYMRAAEAVRILSSGPFPELLLSEYLPGEEYSVDCLANKGDTILAVPRLRKRMINGISVEGEFVKHDSVIEYCTRTIRELQLHGNIGIQLKEREGGEPLLLEINPRVQGSIAAGLGAGINLPVLAVKQALGLPVSPGEMTVKWGTRFSRYWTEVFY